MLYDFGNALIAVVEQGLSTLAGALPDSPFAVSSATISAIAVPAGYAAWFFPVHAMVVELGLFIVAIGVLIIAYVVWRLIWHFTYL